MYRGVWKCISIKYVIFTKYTDKHIHIQFDVLVSEQYGGSSQFISQRGHIPMNDHFTVIFLLCLESET